MTAVTKSGLMTKNKTVRLSVTISGQTNESIRKLAEIRGLSISATVKELLDKGLMIESVIKRGGEVIACIDKHETLLANSEGEFTPRHHSGLFD